MLLLNHRKFDKPCFVPVYSNGLRLVRWVVIIYLQTQSVPSSVQFLQKSAPTIIWVSRSWGLPRSIRPVSKPATLLWHFSGNLIHICRSKRRIYSRRQRAKREAPAYFFAEHEHYGLLRTVRAWTFLYN